MDVASRSVVGVDVFIESLEHPREIGDKLTRLAEGSGLVLKVISNRGTAVWPETGQRTSLVDAFQCRFMDVNGSDNAADTAILGLLQRVATEYRWVHVEKLQRFDGKDAFSKAQGES